MIRRRVSRFAAAALSLAAFAFSAHAQPVNPPGPIPTVCPGGQSVTSYTAFGAALSCGGIGTNTVDAGSAPQISQYTGTSTTHLVPATVSGDGTIAAGGALTIGSLGGKAVTLGGALTTAGAINAGAAIGTFLTTPSSANLRAALTDETGTGLAYFQGGDIGTPSAGVGTNITDIPLSSAVIGTVAAANFPALAGDCTTPGASLSITCTKTSGVAFGTAATVNTGTSAHTLPFLDGNNTWSGSNTFGKVIGTVTTQSGTTYTFGASDCGTTVHFSSGSAVTATLPNDLPVGCNLAAVQDGAGQITFSAASGATLNSAHGFTKTYGQYAGVGLHVGANSGSAAIYTMFGDGA